MKRQRGLYPGEFLSDFFRGGMSSFLLPFLLFMLACHPFPTRSQHIADSVPKPSPAVGYISKMDRVVSIRLNFNNEYDQFILHGQDQNYDVRPSLSVSNRISVNYRFISLGVGFTLRFLPGNHGNDKQGQTRTFYLRMNLFLNHWFQELQYGKLTGLYVSNTSDFIPGWDDDKDPYIQFPGLVVYMVSGSTSYKFNPNFSIKALTTQTEIQRRSCGSFIPSLSYSLYMINNTGEEVDRDINH
jgi:hypothetical protein